MQTENSYSRRIGFLEEDVTFLLLWPERLSGTRGSLSAVQWQPLPGLQIHVDAPFSGYEPLFGSSLWQTRGEVFTDRNPCFIGEHR